MEHWWRSKSIAVYNFHLNDTARWTMHTSDFDFGSIAIRDVSLLERNASFTDTPDCKRSRNSVEAKAFASNYKMPPQPYILNELLASRFASHFQHTGADWRGNI